MMHDDQQSLTYDEEDTTPTASDMSAASRARRASGGRTPQTPGRGGRQSEVRGSQVAQGFDDRSGYHVFVRVRPSPKSQNREQHAVEVVGADGLRIERGASTPDLDLRFDGVLGSQADQADVFDNLKNAVSTVLEGRSCTVLAYGQTGSGKTHTIVGQVTEEGDQYEAIRGPQRGLIPRALEQLFDWITPIEPRAGGRAVTPGRRRISASPKGWRVYLSFLEIYNERVYDLLAGASGNLTKAGSSLTSGSKTARGEFGRQSNFSRRGDSAPHLDVREDRSGGVAVPGAIVVEVKAVEQALEVLRIGTACRTVGHNGVNATSSRSHAVFQVLLKRLVDSSDGGEPVEQVSKLNLVDLAGSEKMQYNSATSGVMLQELTCINLSLSAIGQCIAALVSKKRTHVPYRDSKLTRLLQDSLRGDCMCIMWICISPTQSSLEETLSALKFADRAKRAVLDRPKPPPAQVSLPKGADSSQRTIDDLLSKMQDLQSELNEERVARSKLEAIVRKRSSSADCMAETPSLSRLPSPGIGPLESPGMLTSSLSGSSLGASTTGSRSRLLQGGRTLGARSSSHLFDSQGPENSHVPSRMTQLAEQNQEMIAKLEALEGGASSMHDAKSPGVTSTASLGSTTAPSTVASYLAASPPCNARQERDLPMAWVNTGGNGVEEFFKAAVSRTKAASMANLQDKEAQARSGNGSQDVFKAAASKTKAEVRDRLEVHRQSATTRIIPEHSAHVTDDFFSPRHPRQDQETSAQARNNGSEGWRSPCHPGATKRITKSSAPASARPSSASSTHSTRCPSSVGSCRSFSSATKSAVGATRPSSAGRIGARPGTASSKLRRSLVEDPPLTSNNEEMSVPHMPLGKFGNARRSSSSEGRFSQRRPLSELRDDQPGGPIVTAPAMFRKTSMSPPRCGRVSAFIDDGLSPGVQSSETDNDRVFGDGRRSPSRGALLHSGVSRGTVAREAAAVAAAAAAAFLNDSMDSGHDRHARGSSLPNSVNEHRCRKEQDKVSLIKYGRDILGGMPKSPSICSEEASSVVDGLFSPSKTHHTDSDLAFSSRSPGAYGGSRFCTGFAGSSSPRSRGGDPYAPAATASSCGPDVSAGARQVSPTASPMAAPAAFLNNLLSSGSAGSRRTSPTASRNDLRDREDFSNVEVGRRSLRDILGSQPVRSPGLEAMRRASPSPPHAGAHVTDPGVPSSRPIATTASNASRRVSLEILSGSEASSSSRSLIIAGGNGAASGGVMTARSRVLGAAPGGRHEDTRAYGSFCTSRVGTSSAVAAARAVWDADSDDERFGRGGQARPRAASAGRVGSLSPWAGR